MAVELRRATARHEEAQARTRRKFRTLTFFLCMALLSTLIHIFSSINTDTETDHAGLDRLAVYNSGYAAGFRRAYRWHGTP